MGFLYSYLDKKYKIIERFQDRDNKRFKRVINLTAIISVIIILLLAACENYFNALDKSIGYVQWILAIPFLLRTYIRRMISEKNKMKKEEYKHKHVEISFCYYCGSELNRSSICPRCGKELEL
jgi:uncharacterized membrane protein